MCDDLTSTCFEMIASCITINCGFKIIVAQNFQTDTWKVTSITQPTRMCHTTHDIRHCHSVVNLGVVGDMAVLSMDNVNLGAVGDKSVGDESPRPSSWWSGMSPSLSWFASMLTCAVCLISCYPWLLVCLLGCHPCFPCLPDCRPYLSAYIVATCCSIWN